MSGIVGAIPLMPMSSHRGILVVTNYFYPGFKAGGPPKSIYNIINTLGDSFFSLC